MSTGSKEVGAEPGAALKYCTNMQSAPLSKVGPEPHVIMHRSEWRKLMAAEPVEINPSVGTGCKVLPGACHRSPYQCSTVLVESIGYFARASSTSTFAACA